MNSISERFALRRRISDESTIFVPRVVNDPDLSAAINEDRIAVSFQPIFSLPEGRVAAVEALARPEWSSDASDLFARAAMSGLSERLSRQMQRKALREVARWTGRLAELTVSLNILPEDIGRSGYVSWLLETISQEGVDPSRVAIEITEHAELSELPVIGERLERLRSAGIKIALDDFGTGYASLASLTYLPLDHVKIDRSLIADIETNRRARTLVKTTLGLARDLGFSTIVEGVETAGQLELLTQWGCTLFQGFLRARSMDVEALERFVADQA